MSTLLNQIKCVPVTNVDGYEDVVEAVLHLLPRNCFDILYKNVASDYSKKGDFKKGLFNSDICFVL